MMILGIDPGNVQSAWVIYDKDDRQIVEFGITENEKFRDMGSSLWVGSGCGILAIEYMRPRGMPTAQQEMDTQFWAGRIVERWVLCGGRWRAIARKDVKMHMCGQTKAKDSNIRQAIIDRFPATGTGKCPQIGTKKQPGPLYGVSKDVWSALAIAITAAETTE